MHGKVINRQISGKLLCWIALLFVLNALILTSCTGGKQAYLKLTEPDRILVYMGDQEQIYTKGEQKYSEIYKSIKKSWDSSEKSLVQLVFLETSMVPKEPSRIVFEYDEPIHWREEEMNTYVFFLSEEWQLDSAVICKNGDYKSRAFFPEMDIQRDELLRILEK